MKNILVVIKYCTFHEFGLRMYSAISFNEFVCVNRKGHEGGWDGNLRTLDYRMLMNKVKVLIIVTLYVVQPVQCTMFTPYVCS